MKCLTANSFYFLFCKDRNKTKPSHGEVGDALVGDGLALEHQPHGGADSRVALLFAQADGGG
jgi:hypothetical protein